MATGWLVYHLTRSPLLLGIVGFAGQIVTFVLGPVAGVWVERLNRRKLLVWTQVAAAVQAFAMAALTLAHAITTPEIIALSVLLGAINAFDKNAGWACCPQESRITDIREETRQVRSDVCYSLRSEVCGSILVARQAGTTAAPNATIATSPTTPARVAPSSGRTP